MNAPRDNNRIPTLLGTLNTDGTTIVAITVAPSTHALGVSDGTSGGSGAGVLLDSYSESNQTADLPVSVFNNPSYAQSFTPSSSGLLGSCKFYLKAIGSPIGMARARLYTHSGTYGTSSVPIGSALATSGDIDVTTISGTYGLVTFSFTGANQVSLTSGSHYEIAFEYSGVDDSNKIALGANNTTLGASGNPGFPNSWPPPAVSWSVLPGYDVCFYVYSAVPSVAKRAIRDGNRITTILGVSSDDGVTPLAIYADSSGNLLTKST